MVKAMVRDLELGAALEMVLAMVKVLGMDRVLVAGMESKAM